MPGQSGIDFLKQYLPTHPIPVILVSSLNLKVFDALAVGVTLAFETNVNILLSATIIGLVAFALAMIGGLLGRRLGELFQRRATLLGGLVLVGIGLKILLEHLFGAG